MPAAAVSRRPRCSTRLEIRKKHVFDVRLPCFPATSTGATASRSRLNHPVPTLRKTNVPLRNSHPLPATYCLLPLASALAGIVSMPWLLHNRSNFTPAAVGALRTGSDLATRRPESV